MPTQLASTHDRLIVTEQYEHLSLEAVFDAWTTPTLLQQWWPTEAQLDARVSGTYHFHWPSIGQHLRGRYLVFERGTQLIFTWRWDEDPSALPTRQVSIQFQPLGDGTLLTLTHGFYADTPDDQLIRTEHHLAGWNYFLPRLQAVQFTK